MDAARNHVNRVPRRAIFLVGDGVYTEHLQKRREITEFFGKPYLRVLIDRSK